MLTYNFILLVYFLSLSKYNNNNNNNKPLNNVSVNQGHFSK